MSFANIYTIPGSSPIEFGARNNTYAIMSAASCPTRIGIETDTGLLAHWDAAGVYHRNAPRSTGTVGRLAMFKNATTGELEVAANTSVEVAAAVTASHAQAHALDSLANHTLGSLTNGYLMKASSSANSVVNSLIYDSGSYVGVGESSPLTKFVVRADAVGAVGPELSIINYAAVTVGNAAAINFGLENSTYNGDNCNAKIKAIVTNVNGAADLTFSNWSGSVFAERMRFTSAGYIGIGTASPARQFHLYDSGSSMELILEAAGLPANYKRFNIVIDTVDTYQTTFRILNDAGNAATTNLMTFNHSTGNICIGTGPANAKLDVRGGLLVNDTGGDYDTRMEGDTDVNLFFLDASTDRIGIGTNSPETKFVVWGSNSGGAVEASIVNSSSPFSGNSACLNFSIDQTTYNGTNCSAQIKALQTEVYGSADIIFSTNPGATADDTIEERMRITSGGIVKIGLPAVTSGEYILKVGGLSYAEGRVVIEEKGTTANSLLALYDNHASGSDWKGITLRNKNMAHGVTTILETDAYGFVGTLTNGTVAGGMRMVGCGNSNINAGLQMEGISIGSASYGTVAIDFAKINGTGRTTLDSSYKGITFLNNGTEKACIWGDGVIQSAGYKSSDGTAGGTGTITVASVTSITVKNGLVTAWS